MASPCRKFVRMATKRTGATTSSRRTSSTPRPRSLAEDLRARSDDDIAALLAARPDLVHPVPADLGALATRAATGPSTARALDRLDELTLAVIPASAASPTPRRTPSSSPASPA